MFRIFFLADKYMMIIRIVLKNLWLNPTEKPHIMYYFNIYYFYIILGYILLNSRDQDGISSYYQLANHWVSGKVKALPFHLNFDE